MKTLFIKLRWPLTLCAVLGVAVFSYFYTILYTSNTGFAETSKLVYIHNDELLSEWIGTTMRDSSLFKSNEGFLRVASWKNFERTKPGRYRIRKGMDNNAIVNMLRSGNQEPLKLRIDDTQSIYELAGKLGRHLQPDSIEFISSFTNDSICKLFECNSTTIACLIVPDTYEFFWTMSPIEFLKKMNQLNQKYWTKEKLEKAAKQNLNKTEVCILASIVKAECVKKEEAPAIAGLYLNRLRSGIALQSDPTSLFAAGLKQVERVMEYMTEVESPYNTYLNKGLPPGPINFPEPLYLDAVLNAEQNTHIYMCAQPGATGYHNFTNDYNQHLRNRSEYIKWLNSKGIK